MQRGHLDDLVAFVAVARERSFTKAAAKLGVSQSALSHTMRELEARLGVRLLTRTTRSVAPTEAGERLLHTLGPRFEEIEAELAALSELREKPAGTIRITATDHVADTLLWPKLVRFLGRYPDIKVEIIIDYGLTDIVAQRFDAGVRAGAMLPVACRRCIHLITELGLTSNQSAVLRPRGCNAAHGGKNGL
jgi:DNA-binding transcriptional LysR family regulator